MWAVFLEVNADDAQLEQARKLLPEVAVPGARQAGAAAGYWLAAQNGRGVSFTVFGDEETAEAHASHFTIGEPVGLVPGVTVRSVEVREVIAHFQ